MGLESLPTAIPESKQDTERNFFNLVKGIHKPTVTVPFSAKTLRTFSLESLCSQEQIKDPHRHYLNSVVYAEPA